MRRINGSSNFVTKQVYTVGHISTTKWENVGNSFGSSFCLGFAEVFTIVTMMMKFFSSFIQLFREAFDEQKAHNHNCLENHRLNASVLQLVGLYLSPVRKVIYELIKIRVNQFQNSFSVFSNIFPSTLLRCSLIILFIFYSCFYLRESKGKQRKLMNSDVLKSSWRYYCFFLSHPTHIHTYMLMVSLPK